MRQSFVLFLLCIWLAPATLRAQSDAGSDVLTGRVTDYNGRPVADAQVGVTAVGSGLTRSHSTDAEGRYKIYFPEMAPRYMLQVKRMGFSPVQRNVIRRTKGPEWMTIDMQLGGAPLALSMVEINGSSDAPVVREKETRPSLDTTVPNPVAEILKLKDTLHLSAVQIVGLSGVADTLQAKNSRLYQNIRTLIAKSREAGDNTQMAGSVAIMLEEASANTARAVAEVEKLLLPEQWAILPAEMRGHADTTLSGQAASKQ
jgi:hypothetical protein